MSLRGAAEEGPEAQGKDRKVNIELPASEQDKIVAEVAGKDGSKVENPGDFRMLIVYVSRKDTSDVRLDRTDFADWEVVPLIHHVLEVEFGGRLIREGDEELGD